MADTSPQEPRVECTADREEYRRAGLLADVKFDEQGLVPCVVQEWSTGEVLMVAYMNRESLLKTLETGTTWFWSRSRRSFWNKGETSGHIQKVRELRYDCDADTLLALVEQVGVACHTGTRSCFDGRILRSAAETGPLFLTLAGLYRTIQDRRREAPVGSYAAESSRGGAEAIGRKIQEDAGEVLKAGTAGDAAQTVCKAGDLLCHLLVLLAEFDVELSDLWHELERRKK